MYDGLLLDHDGVIVSVGDESALDRAARNALRAAGVETPDPDAVERLSMWVTETDLLDVSRQYDLDPDALWRHRDEHALEELLDQLHDGGKTLYDDVDVLAEIDHHLGIVSNNQTRFIESVLDHHGIDHHFDTIRARAPHRESLPRKKPEPTLLEEAMTDLAVENPLYVGDSESDVEAGRRAGLDVAYIRREHNTDRPLECDPTYEVTGLDEVVDVLGPVDR